MKLLVCLAFTCLSMGGDVFELEFIGGLGGVLLGFFVESFFIFFGIRS